MKISTPIITSKIIFIIDDDVDDQLLLEEALLEINSSIICYKSNNGEDAIMKLQHAKIPRPELIFADLNMPRLNGRQFLQRLMEDANLNDIPVIIYSTSCREEEVHSIMQMGASAFLQKPNDFNQLISILKKELVAVMMHQYE